MPKFLLLLKDVTKFLSEGDFQAHEGRNYEDNQLNFGCQLVWLRDVFLWKIFPKVSLFQTFTISGKGVGTPHSF